MDNNVIDLEDVRRQNREANCDSIYEAMWFGLEHSIHSRDPNDPTAPGTLARFMAKVADENPLFFMRLLIDKFGTDET